MAIHGTHGGLAESCQTLVSRLREDHVVLGVRQNRDRRRVRGHVTKEEMGKRDVDDAVLGQPADVLVDRCFVTAEVETALDAVDEGDAPVVDEIVHTTNQHVPLTVGVQSMQVSLNVLELILQVLEVTGTRRGTVGPVDVETRPAARRAPSRRAGRRPPVARPGRRASPTSASDR